MQEVRAITGFGRVMLYRFDEEGRSHVLAEDRDESYASFLNQFFPASDIPRQARALYLRNRIRLVANVDYTPARLVPPVNPVTGRPTDLTYATLRSFSPVHLEYMRNMGTHASMSVSIVVRGHFGASFRATTTTRASCRSRCAWRSSICGTSCRCRSRPRKSAPRATICRPCAA